MFKNILTTVIVAAVVAAGIAWFVAPNAVSQGLGTSADNVQQVIWQFTKGVMLEGASKTGKNSSAVFTASGTLAPGQNIDYWTNKTGRTVLFDYADVVQTGTGYASSTMRISVFATSTVSGINPYVAPKVSTSSLSNFLIDNVRMGTSSPSNYVWNADVNGGTNATGTIAVPDGSSLVLFLQQGDYQANCTGSICEPATSTNRGFNLNWFAEGHYVP